MGKVRSLVVTGVGINCEYEMSKAYELLGAQSDIVDIRDIIAGKVDIFDYHVFNLPGGFSYGDDLGAAKALANLIRFKKIKTSNGSRLFIDLLREFVVEQQKIVFGVCNGFQAMLKLGLMPGFSQKYTEQNTTLTFNDSGKFENRWVWLKVNNKSRCIATKGLDQLYLPVRHGEGKFIPANNNVLDRLIKSNHVFVQYSDSYNKVIVEYPFNPNGSVKAIAGICDETGRVFGMMPHPEAALLFENHPQWTRIKNEIKIKDREIPKHWDGIKVFKNIISYCEEDLV